MRPLKVLSKTTSWERKDSDIWNEKQRMFLQEEWKRDAVWVEIIDELNVRMHPSA